MDISAIVVVLVLTALALAAIIWMEIHSRKTSSNESSSDAKSFGSNETEILAQDSSLLSLQRNGGGASKIRGRGKEL